MLRAYESVHKRLIKGCHRRAVRATRRLLAVCLDFKV